VAERQGDHGQATTLLEEALALQRTLGDTHGIASSLASLGAVAIQWGDLERAAALYEESLQLGRDIGARELVAQGLAGMAWLATACGQPHRAVQLGGAAARLREVLGVPLGQDQWPGYGLALRGVRAVLGEQGFDAGWTSGRALPPDAAVALALAPDAAATE
jgi:hypothetical protein